MSNISRRYCVFGLVYKEIRLKKNMKDLYNYTIQELINLRNEKQIEYDFATYSEKIVLLKEIQEINQEIKNRYLEN